MSQTGTVNGSATTDRSTYTIWVDERVNEPSIEGLSSCDQYISIRNSPCISGTVTIENHFNAWADLGMDLGALSFQVIALESWDGAGNCCQTVTN